MSSADSRRIDVLRAIVADFVQSSEPVGSKMIVDRYGLGVSSATVRNDMAVLESEGYIFQPHRSSGRIPTAKGYRKFVDSIKEVRQPSLEARTIIHAFFDGAVDLDDVLQRALRLLSKLTRQVAVIQYPTLLTSKVRHVELVQMTSTRLLIVVITDAGRVVQRTLESTESFNDDDVVELRQLFGKALEEIALRDARDAIRKVAAGDNQHLNILIKLVGDVLVEALTEHPEEKLLLGGTANLTRRSTDFPGSMENVLQALEEQVIILKLFSETRDNDKLVSVQIGEEQGDDGIPGVALVSAGYGTEGTYFGGMGVVGPNRMDYPETIALVSAVAQYVGGIL